MDILFRVFGFKSVGFFARNLHSAMSVLKHYETTLHEEDAERDSFSVQLDDWLEDKG